MKFSTLHAALICSSILLTATQGAMAAGFTVTSPQVKEGQQASMEQVFNGFGCTGQNLSPALHWDNPPQGTKSFAVTVYDPDAPTGSGWWHWVLFNIPAETRDLPKGAGDPAAGLAPAGSVQSMTDYGKPGYGGPCPPPGKPHHYIVTVFALDVDKLPLEASSPAAMVGFNLHQHALAQADFTFLYGR